MINIQIVDTISPDAIKFVKEEWTKADIPHFGHVVNWKKEKKVLQAMDENKIVGILELIMQAGVMYIDELIVAEIHHGEGVGKTLMEKAEEIAKVNNMHKIYLDTGKNWPAVKFYEALGYEKTGEFPKHLEGVDYVIFSKFLS